MGVSDTLMLLPWLDATALVQIAHCYWLQRFSHDGG